MITARMLIHQLGPSLGALALGGCPADPPAEPCSGSGVPVLTLSNRRAPIDLATGREVEVFPPPQGGVFAELDVTIDDIGITELEYVRVEIEDANTGEPYATVRYFGDSIPLICSQQTDLLEVANLPVGFSLAYTLDDLDGRAVVVTGSVDTETEEFPVQYEATLVRTEY
ncbi:MAG: hypothetical protein AAGF11_16625 [Myxococcota bacterium]